MSSEIYMTPHEAAGASHSPSRPLATLRVYGGGLTFCRIGRAIRHRQSDLDEFMARSRARSTSENANSGGDNE